MRVLLFLCACARVCVALQQRTAGVQLSRSATSPAISKRNNYTMIRFRQRYAERNSAAICSFVLLSALLLTVAMASFFIWENYEQGAERGGPVGASFAGNDVAGPKRRLRTAQQMRTNADVRTAPRPADSSMRYLFEDGVVTDGGQTTPKSHLRDILHFLNHL